MFLAPWFLLGLFAVAIPLAIHLRRARHQQRIVFSTTRFFDEQFVRAARKAKLQDQALMVLRMILLALFALALAQPLLKLPGLSALASLAGGGRTVVIVLDDSASMGVVTTRGALLEQAKAAALQVVDGLSPRAGDRAALVLAGRRQAGATAPVAHPTGDLDVVRQAIAAVTVQDLAGDLDSALLAARQALGRDVGGGAGGDEIVVFSDLQAGGHEGGLDLGPGDAPVLFVRLPVDDAAAQNLAVASVSRGAARAMVHVPFTFRAVVQNYGSTLRSAEARLLINGQVVAARSLELSPGRGRIVRFTHRFTEPGWYGGSIEIVPQGSDAIAADNRRHFALHVADRIAVLAVNGAASQVASADELFFFRLALTAGGEDAGKSRITLKEIAPDALTSTPLDDVDVVVLANVGGLAEPAAAALEQYVDGGGSLLVTLGDRVTEQSVARWSGPSRLHGGLLPASVAALRGEAEAAIVPVALEHPALAGFDEDTGGLSAARLRSWFTLQAPPQSVLLATPDDEPVLVEKSFGSGRVMLLATTIDRDWSDLPLQPAFVPLVHRLIGHLAGAELSAGFAGTGQTVALPTSATRLESLRVDSPSGATLYPQSGSDASANPTLLLEVPGVAGVYAVRAVSGDVNQPPRLLLAANVPTDEGRTSYSDEAALEAIVPSGVAWGVIEPAPGSDVVQQTQMARRGMGLWNQLLLLALLAAAVEPWIANRMAQRRALSGSKP